MAYIMSLILFLSINTHAGDINSIIKMKEQGMITEAKVALKEIIDSTDNKNSVTYQRANLELATIYADQKQYQLAKSIFQDILKSNQIPSNVRKNINFQLKKINNEERHNARYGFKGKIDTFIGYSSNVKFESIIDDEYLDDNEDYDDDDKFSDFEEPFEDDFEDGFEDPTTEAEEDDNSEEEIVIEAQDDIYYGLSAHINHTSRISASTNLKSGLLHIARKYDQIESSDFSSTSLYLTPSFHNQLAINFQGTHIRRSEESYANYIGVYPSYSWHANTLSTHIKAGLSKRSHHHDYNSSKDGLKYLTDLHITLPLESKGTFRIGTEYALLSANEAFRSYKSYEIYSNASLKLNHDWGLFTGLSYKKSTYDDIHPDLDKVRKRELKRLDLGVNYTFNNHIGLKFNYSNIINSENIDEFDYSKYNLQSHLQILF